MQQKRLLLALALSTAILFVWSYLLPVKPPQQQPAASTPSPTSSPTTPPGSQPQSSPAVVPASIEDVPHRTLSIITPLYEAKIDSLGAEVVSWIITRNKESNQPIHSVAGTRKNQIPLQLVSQEGLKRQPREAPLQLFTGDNNIDALLVSRNYKIEGADAAGDDVKLVLSPGETKRVSFLLHDSNTGLDVAKTISFDANGYSLDLSVLVKRGDHPLSQVKVKIGPSIGDQGVSHYTFYSVAPEAVTSINGKVTRHPAAPINENKNSPDRLVLGGPVDWAAVGDTYFTMVATSSQPASELELRTIQYNYQGPSKLEKRYLVSALLAIPADGSHNIIYVGPKDHDLLEESSRTISQAIGRSIDLGGLIDYGWLGWLSRPLAVPILKSITFLYRLTGSYGVAIILFTIVIYSLFFPLKWRSSKAMKKAQKLAPRMKELQEKIKGLKQNDPRLKELQVEQLRLMKEGNPLGGCLPLLIQMPFLFALYRAITISLDFRQATFLWLPDLSAGDPYHILELLMAGTMIVLQLITPAPSADPVQRKMMAIGMPLFMLYVLWGAPSGLLLYWLVGNIVGFSQQFLINRLTRSEDDVPPPTKNSPASGSRKKLATAAGT
ncbi:MAG TPA: membrane protein insertase YidC [Pyrinomonadaceae bacterium]